MLNAVLESLCSEINLGDGSAETGLSVSRGIRVQPTQHFAFTRRYSRLQNPRHLT